MSEQVENRTSDTRPLQHVDKHALFDVGMVAGATASGALTGVVAGVASTVIAPPIAEIGPDVDLAVTPIRDGSILGYGPDGIVLEDLKIDTPFGDIGVHANALRADIASGSDEESELIARVAEYKTGLLEPIQDVIVDRMVAGSVSAALILGAAVGVSRYRQRNRNTQESLTPNNHRTWRSRLTKPEAAAHGLNLAVLGCCALVAHGSTIQHTLERNPNTMTAVDERLAEYIPEARSAKVFGAGGSRIHGVLSRFIDTLDRKDEFWNVEVKQKTEIALAQFAAEGGLSWQYDPDIVAFAHIADPQCDEVALNYMFDVVLPALKPDHIFTLGDDQSNMNTMPYEKDCIPSVLRGIERLGVPGAGVNGNHDTNEYVSLKNPVGKMLYERLGEENNYRRKLSDGIWAVGANDERESTWGPTKPADPEAQNKLLAKQGQIIADTAREIKAADPDAIVFGLGHDPAAGREALVTEAVDGMLAGHTHRASNLVAFRNANGTYRFQYTAPSLSGANGGISKVEMPKTSAGLAVHLMSKSKRELVGSVIYSVTPEGEPTFSYQPMPTDSTVIPGRTIDFLDTYSRDWRKKAGYAPPGFSRHNDFSTMPPVQHRQPPVSPNQQLALRNTENRRQR